MRVSAGLQVQFCNLFFEFRDTEEGFHGEEMGGIWTFKFRDFLVCSPCKMFASCRGFPSGSARASDPRDRAFLREMGRGEGHRGSVPAD